MAIPFKSPTPRHRFTYANERDALTAHFRLRKVPSASPDRLLVASWNIANLGVQGRTETALKLIAHIMKRFELIAVQEVNEQYRTFAKVVDQMGAHYEYIMTDTAGNDERLAYVYDARKVTPLHVFGELALRAREFPKRNVVVHYTKNKKPHKETHKNVRFQPFDRNPFIGTFAAGHLDFMLVNTHLYFGKFQNSSKKSDRARYARRVLEIYALSKWAGRRANRTATYDRDIVLMGDMNVPAMDKKEATYKALVAFGFQPLNYPSRIGGSNLGNDKTYDQMAFAPGGIEGKIKNSGVFDFDNALFKPLWNKLYPAQSKGKAMRKFNAHAKHHISDHRPIWIELDIR